MTNLYLAAATDTASMLATFIPLIRPQKKRDKEVQKMRENIEIADEIVTIGGIIGRIVSIKVTPSSSKPQATEARSAWHAGPSSRTSLLPSAQHKSRLLIRKIKSKLPDRESKRFTSHIL